VLATADHYPDVVAGTVELRSGQVPALTYRPAGPGPHPALVIGAEAFGLNDFTRRVAATLAHLGYVTVVPDYYRGDGPPHPEAYDDFTEVVEYISRLDFVEATGDLCAALDEVRAMDGVDPARVGVWGYCTGGTLALLTACARETAAAVLFFPSQPTFAELDRAHPVHPVDLLWAISGPVLFLYGDQDLVMPPERFEDLQARCARWEVPASFAVYPGAGHAFSAPEPPLHHDAADRASWADALAFAARHLAP